jgi:hypothetical protein
MSQKYNTYTMSFWYVLGVDHGKVHEIPLRQLTAWFIVLSYIEIFIYCFFILSVLLCIKYWNPAFCGQLWNGNLIVYLKYLLGVLREQRNYVIMMISSELQP